MRYISDQICKENKKPRFMFNNLFPKVVPLLR